MAKTINPTRMELTNLKRRLGTAVRGHKLLKDKRDEMVRQFMIYVKRNHELRQKMERALLGVSEHFILAKAQMGTLSMSEALLYPARSAQFEVGSKNVMSVDVPTIKYTGGDEGDTNPDADYLQTVIDGSIGLSTENMKQVITEIKRIAKAGAVDKDLLNQAIEAYQTFALSVKVA